MNTINLRMRLALEAQTLEILERRRAETGNADIGRSIEETIIASCLADLEALETA